MRAVRHTGVAPASGSCWDVLCGVGLAGVHQPPSSPLQACLRASACLRAFRLAACSLAYYGLQTNMGLYLKKVLGYPADTASQLVRAWGRVRELRPLAMALCGSNGSCC